MDIDLELDSSEYFPQKHFLQFTQVMLVLAKEYKISNVNKEFSCYVGVLFLMLYGYVLGA